MLKYIVVALMFLPAVSLAQTGSTGSLQSLLVGIGGFLNSVVIPFILAIAFIVFVVNVVRFFVIGGASDEGQKNARNLAIYGIGAFVFILSFWGIVNMLVNGIGLSGEDCVGGMASDYVVRDGNPCVPQNDQDPGGDGDPPGDPPDDPPDPPDDPPNEDDMDEVLDRARNNLIDSLPSLIARYGDLADRLQSDLFDAFLSQQQMTREDEARTLLRATMLQMIPFSTQESFFNIWLSEQIADGILNPIGEDQIRNTLPRQLPANIQNRVDRVKNDILRQLEAYVARGTFVPSLTTPNNPNATPNQVINYLFNQSIPITNRTDFLITLIEDRHDIIDASLGDRIYHEFIDVNNVLTTYNARFNILDERDPNYLGPR